MHDHPTGERTCNVTTPVQLVTTRQVKIDSGRMHALSMNAHPQRLCSNITFVNSSYIPIRRCLSDLKPAGVAQGL